MIVSVCPSQSMPSGSSIDSTERSPHIYTSRPKILHQNDGGPVVALPAPFPDHDETLEPFALKCIFAGIFECDKSFEDPEDWKLHVTGHLMSHSPPSKVSCIVCKQVFSNPQNQPLQLQLEMPNQHHLQHQQQPVGGEAWQNMLDHILAEHPRWGAGGQVEPCPDFDLMRHMYCMGIISTEQFKLLQLTRETPPHLPQNGSAAEPYFIQTSSRRERRQRRPRLSNAGSRSKIHL
ncbi:hypothetical protein MGYG_02488 [Nannizzia gypsea CBS 118893]|uniref:Uncharacterized protein n=1 Tax=Arthroderma gypseum (strain ATCC MYA-4604 / CBS 118893) TaxID=535722 RepID=E4UMW3_ARTGP|nr:hypothetical protein MGYG_02488 [Nannizzia gypsea CBS 118893]EFQ99477.1 hypothetical protein MGYG_02488 [Nannizzia gypsea CBS 118893]